MWVSRFQITDIINDKYKITLYLMKSINISTEIMEYIIIDKNEFNYITQKLNALREKWKEKSNYNKEIQEDYNMWYSMVFIDGYTKIFKPFLQNMEKYRDVEETNKHFTENQNRRNELFLKSFELRNNY